MSSTARKSPGKAIHVRFDPGASEIVHQPGHTLLATAQQHDVRITSACGGRGICKTCIVHFTDGDVPAASDADKRFFSEGKLRKGWRRACQIEPHGNCTVHIPPRARAESARMQVDGSDFWIPPEPGVTAIQVSLTAATLDDGLADADRVIAAINNESGDGCKRIDANVLRLLSETLRQNDWNVQAVVRCDEVIAIQAQETRLAGLAVDLGTTNIGVFLIDLHTGATIDSTGIENPQVVFGSNVIARVDAAVKSQSNADEMHRLVKDAINEAAAGLCKSHRLRTDQIADVVVAGNTTMHHLLARLPVKGLGLAPFAPVIADGLDIKASELGLHTATGAYIHLMPNIAGFVGGDHAAMLLGICADAEERTVIALDVGTNTEISLIHQGAISSLSCPSGPALEGGHISCGMRAATGAIERVSIEGGTVMLDIIGDTQPLGVCGSAVLDTVAAFYRSGGINQKGQINKEYVHANEHDGEACLRLHPDDQNLLFTQEDVRSVQLAKGAIRAGIDLLLETAGLDHSQVDKIVVAGAFGNYVHIDSAITIGMFPALPLDHFEQVGNAAGIGAKMALASLPSREKARSLASSSEYIVQAGNPRFTDIFMRSINFPELTPVQR
jgi:uncharacterized 2Fe-2S/4Fe-4S cluster protein (DUF4445 family)